MEERYTDIRLVKVPIEIDNKNQLNFSSATIQYNYFNSCDYIELDNSSYQRKDNTCRYPGHIDDLIGYNYCMYKNSSYSNKWFYAFITDMQYVNDSMTLVSIKTDVWQTWQFDIEIKKCFVEREHVNDDTIGLHTLPENVETGDYLPMDSFSISYSNQQEDDFQVCVGVTENLLTNTSGITFYGGVVSGIQYIVIKKSDVLTFLQLYASNSKSSSIEYMFMIPTIFVQPNTTQAITWETSNNIHYCFPSNGYTTIDDVYIARPSQLGISSNKYTPKNNKMLTKQFNFIMGDNLVGATAPYYYEYFYDPSSCQFRALGVLTPGCSIKCRPVSYKYTVDGALVIDNSSFSEGLVCAKLPVGSWNTDVYTNWLTQNGLNIGLSVASSALQIGEGIATGISGTSNGISGTASGILGIGNAIAQVYQHSLLPNQVEGNTNSGDIVFASQHSVTRFYRMTIKEENAQVIDEFFSMFGYKVNRVKIPNITGRTNWNYVKTIDCNIHGYIPQKDCIEIKNMFNAGVTFWHNPSTFLDYNQSNTIVSGS